MNFLVVYQATNQLTAVIKCSNQLFFIQSWIQTVKYSRSLEIGINDCFLLTMCPVELKCANMELMTSIEILMIKYF